MTGILNCHAKGLHSIVLEQYEDGRPKTRMFCTDENHDLWKNNPNEDNLSIAIHPHRCDITIHHLYGPLININLFKDNFFSLDHRSYNQYRYKSCILTGEMEFTYLDTAKLRWGIPKALESQSRLFLPASRLRTVNVAKGFRAAWIIEEGPLDPQYDALVYTSIKPKKDLALYQPMSKEKIDYYLNMYAYQLLVYFLNPKRGKNDWPSDSTP